MSQIERTRNLLSQAVCAIDEKLGVDAVVDRGPMSAEQLHAFRQTLLQMSSSLESSANSGNKGEARNGMGRVIVDSWPIDSQLGELILAAEQEYRIFFNQISG